ncbi:hypothetical protein LB553_00855 [Mesorhizobium sp. CA8]|uniref:hypothetical protein n=1 Tax=Mesorhizobium sp. CA8 TaxID=2876637 RepID=UPI001CCEF090|nr:hypothetical protein [Mesorhizobium sp. CA8]MBZ9759436.1 hypothetical protein [Mesorhizobium sp. CA8]
MIVVELQQGALQACPNPVPALNHCAINFVYFHKLHSLWSGRLPRFKPTEVVCRHGAIRPRSPFVFLVAPQAMLHLPPPLHWRGG